MDGLCHKKVQLTCAIQSGLRNAMKHANPKPQSFWLCMATNEGQINWMEGKDEIQERRAVE